MRIKGIIFLVVVIAICFVLSVLLTDKWLEKRLEILGSSIVGAKVEINHLDFSPFSLHVKWDSLQVTNPNSTMKNLFTTGPSDFDVQFAPLLRKKVIIEDIRMTNFTVGTSRTEDGKIEKPKKKKEQKPNIISKTVDRIGKDVAEAPAWNLEAIGKKVNVDSILAFLKLESPEKIDSLQKNISQTYNQWDSTLSSTKWNQDFNDLEDKITSINPGAINTLPELQTALTTSQQVLDQVKLLEKQVGYTEDKLVNDIKKTRDQVSVIDDWIKEDYKNALNLAKLPSLNQENIAYFLFGKKVTNQVTQILDMISTARSFSEKFKTDKPKKEKPPRLKGQTIHFTKESSLPGFWIQNINLSGFTTKGLKLAGSVKNIVSDQKLIGHPTTCEVTGERGDGANLYLFSEFNYLKESPSEKFILKMAQMPLNSLKLSDSPLLPNKIDQGYGLLESQLEIGETVLQGDLNFVAQKLRFQFEQQSSDKLVEKTIQKILKNISTLDLKANLKSSEERTVFGFDSNLDDLFARELRNIAGDEVKKARDKIETQVNQKLKPYREKINNFVSTQSDALNKEMNKYKNMLQEYSNRMDKTKKDIEQRIEDEKKKQQDNVKKKIEGLLK